MGDWVETAQLRFRSDTSIALANAAEVEVAAVTLRSLTAGSVVVDAAVAHAAPPAAFSMAARLQVSPQTLMHRVRRLLPDAYLTILLSLAPFSCSRILSSLIPLSCSVHKTHKTPPTPFDSNCCGSLINSSSFLLRGHAADQDTSAAADLLRPLTEVYGTATVTNVTLTSLPSPPPPGDLKILGVPMPTNDVGLAGLFLVSPPLQPCHPSPFIVAPFAHPFAVGAWAVPRSVHIFAASVNARRD